MGDTQTSYVRRFQIKLLMQICHTSTRRDVVQLRLTNTSPGKVYAPGSAGLQHELLRRSWEKSPYWTKPCEKFRRESPDCNSPYLFTEAFWGQHPLLPSLLLHLEIPSGPLGCSQV